jgi:hypothetical protein
MNPGNVKVRQVWADAGVHIRFCGQGGLWFRSYSGSLSKSAKVTKALLPLSFGASLWLGTEWRGKAFWFLFGV